jgi:hypothetical protein
MYARLTGLSEEERPLRPDLGMEGSINLERTRVVLI